MLNVLCLSSSYFVRLTVLAVCWLLVTNANSSERPNIVLIFADDLGWKDVGFQSDGVFLTPNIDALARSGMTFTDAYSSAGNCAPSRACMLSGYYTPRHQVYAVGSTDRGPKDQMRLIPVKNKNGLGTEFETFAEALQRSGYVTGHFGKWHLSGRDGAKPSEQGFMESYDSFGNGQLEEGSESNKKGPPEDPKGVFDLTSKACEFIEKNRSRPFLCYLPHHAIHTPLQLRTETEALFKAKQLVDKPSVQYLGCTYDLDASIGMLINKLKELQIDHKTLVIFTSDNGATPGSSQEPLRGNKGCYYEGGIRVPFIASWPGHIRPGSTCSVPVINVDLFPTFIDVAGAVTDRPDSLDGESLLPLLTETGILKRKAIFWHFPGYLDRPVTRGRDRIFRTRPVTVMRQGDWKMHLYHEEWLLDGQRENLSTNRAVELYNLRQDISEQNDVANHEVAIRDELLDVMLDWVSRSGAKLASPN